MFNFASAIYRNSILDAVLVVQVAKGSVTFCSPVYSLLRMKVSTENIRSLERIFPGTFVPRSDILGSELYE